MCNFFAAINSLLYKEKQMENKQEILRKVNVVLEQIRPYLQADGGDISLVGLTDDMEVCVELEGACNGCPHKTQTIHAGVERTLKAYIPEIKGVVEVSK